MTRLTRSQIKSSSNSQDQSNQDHQDGSPDQTSAPALKAVDPPSTSTSTLTSTSTSTSTSLPFHPPQSPFQFAGSSSAASSPAHSFAHQALPQSNVAATPASNAPRRKSTGGGGGNRKGNPPERRAQHNAVERARRESLNVRFFQLAAILPAIADVKRPSKSLIVNKSLSFVEDALAHEGTYRSQILKLQTQNDSLLAQLNNLRKEQGLEPVEPRSPIQLPVPLSDVDAAKARASSALVDTAGVLPGLPDEGDDISGDGGSVHSPHQEQGSIPPPTASTFHDRYRPQYGFAPVAAMASPVAHPDPRYYDASQASGSYFHQHHHSPAMSVAESQYSPHHPSVQYQGQANRPMQSYIPAPHHQQQHQHHQSQHFESAMDVEGKFSMASTASNSVPHYINNNTSPDDDNGIDNNDYISHNLSSSFNYNSNNFSSNFNSEFSSFGGINFGGFGNNVMLEA